MGLLLFRFWPALLPLLIYLLWHATVWQRARQSGNPPPRFRDGPWYWAVLASLLIAVACFILLGSSLGAQKGEYFPPHMENGAMVPAQVGQKP